MLDSVVTLHYCNEHTLSNNIAIFLFSYVFLVSRGPHSMGIFYSLSSVLLGKVPVPGPPTIWITVGQWPTALAVGANGDCLDIFTLIYPVSPHSLSLVGRQPDID